MDTNAHHIPRLGVNFMILSGGEVISKLLTFATFAYLARVLGPEVFGIIELALATTLIFRQIVTFGTTKYGCAEVAKDKNQVQKLTAHIIAIRSVLALGAFFLIVTFVAFINEPWSTKQIILLFGVSLFGFPYALWWVFLGFSRMHWIAVFSIFRYTLFALLVFLWIREPDHIWKVALFEIIAVTGMMLLNLIVFQQIFGTLEFQLDIRFGRSIIQKVFPIFLTNMIGVIKLYIPAILLGLLLTENSEIGWFRASQRIVLALTTFIWLYFMNLLPSIACFNKLNLDTLSRLMHNSIRVTFWSGIFIGAIGSTFARPLVSFIYGEQYLEVANIFQFMIWLIAIYILSGHFRYMLIGLGQQKLVFRSTAIGASSNVLLCFILIPRYGAVGAAWSILGAEVLTCIFAYYYVHSKITRIPILCLLLKPLFAGLIMLVTFQFFPTLDFWIRGGLGILLFILSMIILQPTLLADARALAVGNPYPEK